MSRLRPPGAKLTLAPAIELDGDLLVHVLPEIEDILLLGPLTLTTSTTMVAVPSPLSPSTASTSASPTSIAAAASSSAAAVRGSVSHGSGDFPD